MTSSPQLAHTGAAVAAARCEAFGEIRGGGAIIFRHHQIIQFAVRDSESKARSLFPCKQWQSFDDAGLIDSPRRRQMSRAEAAAGMNGAGKLRSLGHLRCIMIIGLVLTSSAARASADHSLMTQNGASPAFFSTVCPDTFAIQILQHSCDSTPSRSARGRLYDQPWLPSHDADTLNCRSHAASAMPPQPPRPLPTSVDNRWKPNRRRYLRRRLRVCWAHPASALACRHQVRYPAPNIIKPRLSKSSQRVNTRNVAAIIPAGAGIEPATGTDAAWSSQYATEPKCSAK